MSRESTGAYWGVSGRALLHSQVADDMEISNRRHSTVESSLHPSSPSNPLGWDFPREVPLNPPWADSLTGTSPSFYPPYDHSPRHELEHTLAPRRPLHLSQLVTDDSTHETADKSLQPVTQRCGAPWIGIGQPHVELTAARRSEIIKCMNNSVERVVASMQPEDETTCQWKFKFATNDLAYFVDDTSVRSDQTRFACMSYTHATVDELVGLFVPREDAVMLRNHKVVFSNVLNSKLLLTLHPPTLEHPLDSMYVRYTSFKTSGLVPNRELYVVVATNMMRQADGSTIGYCLWDSIDDYEIMSARRTTGFELTTCFRSGFFFHHPGRLETSGHATRHQGPTKIVYMVGMDGGGPWGSSRLVMEKHGTVVARLCSYFRRKYLDPSMFVTKMQWQAKSDARRCKECTKSFTIFSTRVHCHACGHLVCKRCVSKEWVKLHAIGLVSVLVCFACLRKAGLPAPMSVHKRRARWRQTQWDTPTSTFPRRQPICVSYTQVSVDQDMASTRARAPRKAALL
ncbi:hypothetical protein PsorP6_010253 [Peronosclerospora sorghi]|uniref:Uncharacterized protein n=1 Tax=Peronosclerospora sorghi TaxID=230839 RepID=A0ACC0VTL9_9STRA|nr:hypothetical protein PsorP6_010253 [Peronosclerospora sorghi]